MLKHLFVLALMLPALANGQPAPLNKPGRVHLVSKIVGKDFLSETIRIGDLNGDGAPDILFVQNLYGPRGFCIYVNTQPLATPSLYNMNLYPGM